MGRRRLTDAEIRAYEELARAARKLQEAQRDAEAARGREAEASANLSLSPSHERPGQKEGERGE
jgi:hypothetical protein